MADYNEEELMALLETDPVTVMREIREEEAFRLVHEKFRFYEPNGACEQYIAEVGSDKRLVTLFSAANGVGKCLDLEAPVLMADGSWRLLGEIKAGDMVIGHDYDSGEAVPSRVISTSRAGLKQLFKINFKDGGYVIASKEHSFPIKVRSGRSSKVKKIKLEEIMEYKANYVGGILKFQSPKSIEFSKGLDLPIHPYLLGILLGDGGLTEGVRFTAPDQEILERVKSICTPLGYKITPRNTNADCIDWNIIDETRRNNRLLNEIRRLKLNVKSGDKFIPSVYKTASIEDRKQLLAGLIDSDGTFKEFLSKSEKLADDFCYLVKSLGGRAIKKNRTLKTNFTNGEYKEFFRVYWRFDFKLPLALDRKQVVSKRPVEYTNRFVKSIEPLGVKECGDMYIDHPKHCYVSYDFVSTGNTAASVNILANIMYGKENLDNPWFDHPLYRDWPYPKRGRIVSEAANIEKNIIPSLEEWLPLGRYKAQKGTKSFLSKWETDNGWTFDIMTNDQDPAQFEGPTLGWIWCDEPPTETIYKACISRLRSGGVMFISATPLNGSAWMYDTIVAKKDKTVDVEQLTQ